MNDAARSDRGIGVYHTLKNIYTDAVVWGYMVASFGFGYLTNSWVVAFGSTIVFSALYLGVIKND